MFGEKKSMKRGSCFIQPVSSFAFRPKAKKNIYSKPSNEDFPEHYLQRQTMIGDGDFEYPCAPQLEKDFLETCTKKSCSVIVDKKNVKNGHFAKLKKKEEYKKYVENKSKSLEMQQLQSTIAKIQSKIDELSKAIESKATVKTGQVTQTLIVETKRKLNWNKRKSVEGFGAAIVIIAGLMLCLFIFDHNKFSRSIFSSKSFGNSKF